MLQRIKKIIASTALTVTVTEQNVIKDYLEVCFALLVTELCLKLSILRKRAGILCRSW